MRFAVTGITSGIGRRFAEVAVAAGHGVAALVRDPAARDATAVAELGVRLVRGDVTSKDTLVDVARGADVFVHMAAAVGDTSDAATFERINVGGTTAAIDAASAVGVTRFVHMSSSAVYGRPDSGRVTELWPTRFSGLPYEDTKVVAERIAFERGASLGLGVVAVRPPVVYGPYDRHFLPRVTEALRRKRFVLVGGGAAPLNLVWVDHVVDVVLRVASRSDLAGEAFNVMDEGSGRPPSVREVATLVARERHLPEPRLSLPYPIAFGLGHVLARGFAAAGAGPPPLNPFVVKLLTRNVVYDADKARRVLGWTPKTSTLEGLREVLRASAP